MTPTRGPTTGIDGHDEEGTADQPTWTCAFSLRDAHSHPRSSDLVDRLQFCRTRRAGSACQNTATRAEIAGLARCRLVRLRGACKP
jgi:hypothetical protein